MPAIHGGIEQKLALKSVQGGTLLRESLKAGLIFRAAQEQLYTVTETERRNPLKQVWGKLGGFFFFSDKKKKSPITPKRKMTGKEGAYPVYPLYNHPSKKNVIVCKTNLPVFLTNFSLFRKLRFSTATDGGGSAVRTRHGSSRLS